MAQTSATSNGTSNVQDLYSKESAYDLGLNNLQDLVSFETTPAGLCVVSKVALPAGSHFSYITSHAPQPKASWKTIQTSATTQTDPRSALLYMNHSCAPSLEVHTYAPDSNGNYPSAPPSGAANDKTRPFTSAGLAGEVTVARDRDVKPGDALTFFYPSTEWHMDRPFDCLCGAGEGVCLGKVSGSDQIDSQTLDRWFVNDHIWQLAQERDSKGQQ